MQSSIKLRIAIIAATAAIASGHADAQPMRCASAPSEQAQRLAFNTFVDTLLIERNPQKAFESAATPDMKQHAVAFGTNRASTIKQYDWILTRPGSVYTITSFAFEGDLGTVRFHGIMNPGQPGANITVFFRFNCGQIVESWDILQFEAPNPKEKP